MAPIEEKGAEKSIRLEFFAQFREDCGRSEDTIRTACRTAGELYEELDAAYHFHADRASARVAVNDNFAAWDTELEEGDTVVFLSPFGGG